MRFLFRAVEGPRNGRMRDYFEARELSLPPRARRPADPPPAQRRFDEAREQLLAINGWPDPFGERSRTLACPVGAAALAHA